MNSRLFLVLLAGAALAFPAAAQNTRSRAVRICKNDIQQQVFERFGVGPVYFPVVNLTANPGRNDWITGRVQIGRGARAQFEPFSCSANFFTGKVRSAQLETMPPATAAAPVSSAAIIPVSSAAIIPVSSAAAAEVTTSAVAVIGGASRDIDSIAVENCQAAAAGQIRGSGYGGIRFNSVNLTNGPVGEHIWGSAWSNGGMFSYSCSLDPGGNVLSSNVTMRR